LRFIYSEYAHINKSEFGVVDRVGGTKFLSNAIPLLVPRGTVNSALRTVPVLVLVIPGTSTRWYPVAGGWWSTQYQEHPVAPG
jgi:hypothetical protein